MPDTRCGQAPKDPEVEGEESEEMVRDKNVGFVREEREKKDVSESRQRGCIICLVVVRE